MGLAAFFASLSKSGERTPESLRVTNDVDAVSQIVSKDETSASRS